MKKIAITSLVIFIVVAGMVAQEKLGPRLVGTLNGLTITTTTGTFTLATGKTLTVNKTITLDGTDGVTITGPPSNATVATLGLTNTLTGRQDASGAASTSPAKAGTSIPGTCTVGDQFFKTDATAGQNLYYCTATNTFTQQLNSGGGGAAARPYLNYQGTLSNVSGNGTLFTYTVPANTLGATGCIAWKTNLTSVAVGSGSPAWNISFGGTVVGLIGPPPSVQNVIFSGSICNTGTTGSQVLLLDPYVIVNGSTYSPGGWGPGISATFSIDTTASAVLALTVSGVSGGTNTTTPGYFLVY